MLKDAFCVEGWILVLEKLADFIRRWDLLLQAINLKSLHW